MTQPTLFGDVPPEPARKSRGAAISRPHWSRVTLRHPPGCDACRAELHKVWRDGKTPYVPPKAAKWVRNDGSGPTYWCEGCAALKKMDDERRYPR